MTAPAADGGQNGSTGNGSTGTSFDAGGGSGGSGTNGSDGGASCDDALQLTVRDFTEAHPDFEGHDPGQVVPGLVEEDLGDDGKPVFAAIGDPRAFESRETFDQWYRDTEDVNMRVEVEVEFQEQDGRYVYDNSAFFPINGRGLGDGPGNTDRNYLFTTEAHTKFTYEGGENFTFVGDDDLWIFINGKLAIDLGGTHVAVEGTIDLDQAAERLGIEVDETYPMDIFHAERHTVESNFRIETTIDLSCIENVEVI